MVCETPSKQRGFFIKGKIGLIWFECTEIKEKPLLDPSLFPPLGLASGVELRGLYAAAAGGAGPQARGVGAAAEPRPWCVGGAHRDDRQPEDQGHCQVLAAAPGISGILLFSGRSTPQGWLPGCPGMAFLICMGVGKILGLDGSKY